MVLGQLFEVAMDKQQQITDGTNRPVRRRSAKRAAAVVLSLMAHALVLVVLLATPAAPPMSVEPEAIVVSLVAAPPALKVDEPPAPAKPAKVIKPKAKAVPKKPQPILKTRPQPVRHEPEPLPVGKTPTIQPIAALSDAQLAGAATAEGSGSGSGSGGGGRACNMVRFLQSALRRDPKVQAAVAQAHRNQGSPNAVLMWNGDWVRSTGQEGEGLAGVREAIMVEVAFAPEACRAEPVHGLVLISLSDGPGAPRLAMGSGNWRWPDLLFPR